MVDDDEVGMPVGVELAPSVNILGCELSFLLSEMNHCGRPIAKWEQVV
jgi:hypothetical protein